MTDLGEIVRTRLAEKAEAGRMPTKADLAWLDATQERTLSESSVELSRNAKGEMQFTAKVYAADPLEAERLAKEIVNRLRAVYPMSNGTTGAPMAEPKAKP